MLIAVVLLYLIVPPIMAATYALLWPTIPGRVALFITVGSILGVIIALGTLFWAAQPLVGAGIAGAPPGQPANTVWSLLGSRLLTGAIIDVLVLYVVLHLLARMLRPR